MDCSHDGYRTVSSNYDNERGVLVYFWSCEACGVRLQDALREEYRPSFDPRGNDPYLASAA